MEREGTIGVDTNLKLTHCMEKSWNADLRAGVPKTISVKVGAETFGANAGVQKS